MVSVIIPAYNAEHCIRRAIDSILAQSYEDFEVVVVDDGSTDGTAEVVKQYGEKVKYIYQENAGVSVARNTGVAAAKGQWVAFLDADDEWLPDKLKRQMELLARNSLLRWCATNFAQTDGTRSSPRIGVESLKEALSGRDYIENFFVEAGKGRCHIGAPTVVAQKRLFEQFGGFEAGRVNVEDLDMWLRIAHRYPSVGFIAEPLVIVHLDVENPDFDKRRLSSKRGINERAVMNRHLELARELGTISVFRPLAVRILRRTLLAAIYNGYKADARETVGQLRELFGWHWRLGTYLLTVFPGVTSAVLKTLAYICYLLGFEKLVTRRWSYSRKHQ